MLREILTTLKEHKCPYPYPEKAAEEKKYPQPEEMAKKEEEYPKPDEKKVEEKKKEEVVEMQEKLDEKDVVIQQLTERLNKIEAKLDEPAVSTKAHELRQSETKSDPAVEILKAMRRQGGME